MVQTAIFDPIVVQPSVTGEIVVEVLTRGIESAKVDFKVDFDPSNAESRLRLVKHVLAMANTAGGYIFVGVANSGDVVGLAPGRLSRIDEASVRAQVSGYSSIPIPIFVNSTIVFQGKHLAVVAVMPIADHIVVASAEAQHFDGKRNQTLFRKGDVLVRHGSASERWNQNDAEYMVGAIVDRRKEKWYQEFSRDLQGVLTSTSLSNHPPVDQAMYDREPQEFQAAVIGLMRGHSG